VVSIALNIAPNSRANIFRLLRIARDIKVKELANKLRVTPEYINAIERGKKIPSCRLIKDYSDVLNVDESIIIQFNKESENNSPFEKKMLSLLKLIVE
jgi:transcriptional regulator with XRE-family HTH domain